MSDSISHENLVAKLPLVSRRHVVILKQLAKHKMALVGISMLLMVLLVAIFAPTIAPNDPEQQDFENSLEEPSAEYIMGTDSFGRDVFSRLVFGARISLFVGLSVIGVSMLVGVPLGLISGYYSGRLIDPIIMRVMDSVLSFPSIILALTIMAILGTSLLNVVLALSIVNIPVFARLVRGNVLSVKEEDYINSAKAAGSSDPQIILRYILPNVSAPIIVQGTLVFAFAILAEAALSFLGVGTSPPTPSWGLMLNEGKEYLDEGIWISVASGLAIMVTVLSLNFLGDALRDVLDPRYMDEEIE